MRQIRKISIMLVALFLCIGLQAGDGTAQAKTVKGKWKKNITWTYDTKSRVLVVEGSGKIADQESTDDETIPDTTPGWKKYYLEVRKVIIRGNITEIGSSTFYDFRNMTSLQIPDSVRKIQACAFWHSDRLKKVKLPSKLVQLEFSSFGSSGLREITISPGVKKVGWAAFDSNSKLEKVTVCEGVETLGEACFWGNDKLAYVSLPNSLKEIGISCFSVAGLKRVTIPENVEKIGKLAFASPSVEEATLKKVVIKSKKIEKWGKDIFLDASRDLVIRVPKEKKKEYTRALRKGGLPEYVKVIS